MNTVRWWAAEGRIAARRLPSGQRHFDDFDVRKRLHRYEKELEGADRTMDGDR